MRIENVKKNVFDSFNDEKNDTKIENLKKKLKLMNDFTRKLTSLTKILLKTNVIFVTILKKTIILAIYDVDIHIVKRVVKKTFSDYNEMRESND